MGSPRPLPTFIAGHSHTNLIIRTHLSIHSLVYVKLVNKVFTSYTLSHFLNEVMNFS